MLLYTVTRFPKIVIYNNTATFIHVNYIHTTRHAQVYAKPLRVDWVHMCHICQFICLSVYLSASLYVCLSVCLSICVWSFWKHLCRKTQMIFVIFLQVGKRWEYLRQWRTNLQMYVSSYYAEYDVGKILSDWGAFKNAVWWREFFIWTFQPCGSSSAVGVPWELPSLNRVWASRQDTSGHVTSAPRTNKGGPRSIQK